MILAVMAVGADSRAVLATYVVVAGLFLGVNNTLVTETVMKAAPVERGFASCASAAADTWIQSGMREIGYVVPATVVGRQQHPPPQSRTP